MKIGLISDTHGYFDPRIPELFDGVDHILHAGDIGLPALILELEQIAPVTAVLGNNDADLDFKETEVIQFDRHRFLLHHIVDVTHPAEAIQRRIEREQPDVVVFGHTHRPFCQGIGRTLYLNPGYAGKPRFGLARSVAVAYADAKGVRMELKEL